MSFYGVYIPTKTNFEGSVELCPGSVAAINYKPVEHPTEPGFVKPAYDPDYPPDSAHWLIFQEKSKALDVLRQCKEGRLREFPNIEQALRYVQFGFESVESMKLCGKVKKQPSAISTATQSTNPSVSFPEATSTDSNNEANGDGNESTQSNGDWTNNTSNCNPQTISASLPVSASGSGIVNIPSGLATLASAERPPFRAPTKQELVEFRKKIEAGDYNMVHRYILENPRYLISSGDTPSNLKEGYRYNAMHICAQFDQPRIAELILHAVSDRRFASLYTGKRGNPNMCATLTNTLLDYYLNMPDKGRSETPLHFASKNGHVEVVAVLTSFVQCKSLANKDGQKPKDIICQRARNPDPEVYRKIELLLTERFFVPVLRAPDLTLPPQVGQPFSSNNPPEFCNSEEVGDPHNPDYKIKALAGPMNMEQAQKFCRRWKTPPRLAASSSPSPMRQITPLKSPYCVKNRITPSKGSISFPLRRRMLFSPSTGNKCVINGFGTGSEPLDSIKDMKLALPEEEVVDSTEIESMNGEIYCKLADKQNGNHEKFPENQQINVEPNQPEPVDEHSLIDYGIEANNNSTHTSGSSLEHYEKFGTIAFPNTPARNGRFKLYRSAEDSFNSDILNSPTLQNSFNSSELDDSYKERHIKNTDFEKGLEVIGRQLAKQENVDWSEHWDFLDEFVDIAQPVGLEKLEQYFVERKNMIEAAERPSKQLDYAELCSALSKCGVNGDGQRMFNNFDGTPSKLSLPQHASMLSTSTFTATTSALATQLATTITTTIPQANTSYTCVEKSLQVFAKRMTKTIVNNINNVVSINDTLLSELKRLKSLICSFKEDTRFHTVDFSKVHSRIGNLVAIYISQSQEVMLANKIKIQDILRSQLIKSGERREHLECVFAHMLQMLEQSSDELPDYLKTEELCSAAWAQEKACDCQWEANLSRKTSRRKRTESFYAQQLEAKEIAEIKDKQQSESSTQPANVTFVSDSSASTVQSQNGTEENDDTDEEFWSNCGSDDECFHTPPGIRTPDSMIEEQKYKLYIFGDEPTKRDLDVFIAISNADIEIEKFPNIFAWKEAMLRFSSEEMDQFPSPTLVVKTHKPRISLSDIQLTQQSEQETGQQKGSMPLIEFMMNEQTFANDKSNLYKLTGKNRRLLVTPKLKSVSVSLRAEAVANATNAANVANAASQGSVANTVATNTALPTTPIAVVTPTTSQSIYRTPLSKVRGLFSKYRETVQDCNESPIFENT